MNTRKLVYTALFAALTAAGAFLRIPMGFSSVTLQYLFTAMAGLLLGRRWGAVSQAVYVLLGLVGLPIFTMGGGLGYVFQPTFGFLLGLIPAAWVVGRVCGDSLAPAVWPWPPWPVLRCCTPWGCPTWPSSSTSTWARA